MYWVDLQYSMKTQHISPRCYFFVLLCNLGTTFKLLFYLQMIPDWNSWSKMGAKTGGRGMLEDCCSSWSISGLVQHKCISYESSENWFLWGETNPLKRQKKKLFSYFIKLIVLLLYCAAVSKSCVTWSLRCLTFPACCFFLNKLQIFLVF